MRALLVLFLLLLVQSGLVAFALKLAGVSPGGFGDLAPGYVSGQLRSDRAGSPAQPTGINPDRTSPAPPSR